MMVVTVFTILISATIVANVFTLPTLITSSKSSSVNGQQVELSNTHFEGDIVLVPTKLRGLVAVGTSVRWSNGIVPYEFAPGYTADLQMAIVSRMRKLESLVAINNIVCVQFRPRISSDLYYITIRNGSGCSSYVGQNTGISMERTVTLQSPGCIDDGRIMHEFMHTLGFFHEQSRPDRDSYIKINAQNIQTGMASQFTKYDTTVTNTFNTPYDYSSVMHYKKTDFSSNTLPTIEPLQANVKIGQRYKLSSIDIQQVQLFYNCSSIGTPLPPTTTPNTSVSINTSIYTSALTSNNLIFARNGGFASNYYYETILVTIPMAGTYSFECTSTIDTFASVYYTSFNPSNPATNLIGSVDDSDNDNWEFKFSITYSSADTMILVVTTYSPNVIGPFSIAGTGPAKVNFIRTATTVKSITTTTTTSTATSTRITTTTTISTTATIKSITTMSPVNTTTIVAPGTYVSINLFYPTNITQGICPSGYSWTMWFNTGQPSNSTSGDKEDASIILTQNPTTMCRVPFGIQAQSINARVYSWSAQCYWNSPSSVPYLLSFQSFAPGGVDFRVRYCCSTGSFIGTTTTTTTPRPLESTICGKQEITSRSNLMTRIVGGTEAIPNSWPWMVYYQETRSTGTGIYYGVCGATLINNNYVITAAHCIGTTNPSFITLIAGAHNVQSTTETNTQQRSIVQTIYIHPQYDKSVGSVYDIAVLRVSTPFTFTKYVQPACLPGPEPQPGDQVVIAGWGATTFGGFANNVLKQAYTKIIGDCELYWPWIDNARQICVANVVSGDSACQGDSGGPILAQYNGRYVVSGIASFIQICNTTGPTNAPNVYIRSAFYKDWIKGITG